jgi:hypothetical protein
MIEVLHTGRRKRRPWTPQEQVTAEVAAACGVTMHAIGNVLNRGHAHIRSKLNPGFRENKIAYDSKYYEQHREQSCAAARQWHVANRERSLQNKRAWHAKNCHHSNARKRAWWHGNKSRAHAAQRLWRESNREKHLESSRQWRQINVYRHRENAKKWREANIDRHKENHRQWRLKNLEHVKQALREWRQANPDSCREYRRSRSALLRSGRRRALESLTLNTRIKRFAIWSNSCAYCYCRGKMEADHVLALNSGGLHEPVNIVPACRRCNASKSDNPVETWYRKQPFFTEARWRKIQRHCPAAVVGQLSIGA